MIEINGINGGGQVLRSALSLSMVTGQAFRMTNIRGKRKKPGLKRQHLTCVQAAASISDGVTDGAELNSTELVFKPNTVKPGEYQFSIGTAGSTCLVFQTLLPALMLANTDSNLTISGGTHNPMAPSADYLTETFLPIAKHWGVDAQVECSTVGFAPAGGGSIKAQIQPSKLKGHTITERGETTRKELHAICLNIPGSIMLREVTAALQSLNWKEDSPDIATNINQLNTDNGAGNSFAIQIDNEHTRERFTEYGVVNRSAEKVANLVTKEVKRYLTSSAAVGDRLADQLLLPMALAGSGSITVQRMTNHLKTNIEVIQQFLDLNIQSHEKEDHHLIEVF